MIKLKDILLTTEQLLKQSHITLLQRLYSAYASNRKSKSSLKKLYKLQTNPLYAEIFKGQKIAAPPYYRGMSLDKVPEVGDTFKFGLGGWTVNEKVAKNFAHGSKKNRILFETTDKQHVFIDLKAFGLSIKKYIETNYPDWKDDNELNKLHASAEPAYNESEVIFEPFTAKVKQVTKVEHISANLMYYIEV